MGPNTTGKPNTADYSLGRGALYFAELDANDRPKAYRHLGNAPEFNVSVETETLEHQSSLKGLKITDKEVVISQKLNLSVSLDELNHENLANFFSGVKATHTNVSVAGFTVWVMVPDGELVKGRWYDIKNSTHKRAYDVDSTKLTVQTNETTPVAMVLNTDYELDEVLGRIFILSTSTVADTAIAAGKGLKVTLTADATAVAVNEVRSLTKTSVRGALKFVAENPADADKKSEYQFHKVSLKAEGDFSLIGDEFTTMQLTAVAEKNTTADGDSPTLTIRNPVQ